MPAPRLSRGKVIKLDRLLNMLYKPGEIAEELGVSVETVYRSYIPAGAPVIREAGIIWINGEAFRKWAADTIATTRRGKIKREMTAGQGYCVHCNQVVDMMEIRIRPHSKRTTVVQVSGRCPTCGGKVNRLARKADLQQ